MEVINKEKFNELMNKEGIVVVNFFATWCGPCQMFGPVYNQVASDNKEIEMVKVDIDQEKDLTIQAGVRGVPTIIAYKNGKAIDRFSGFRPKEELQNWVNKIKE